MDNFTPDDNVPSLSDSVPHSTSAPSHGEDLSVASSDVTQHEVQHTKAVLRQDLKKDCLLNALFEDIHPDVYLHAITKNLSSNIVLTSSPQSGS